MNGVFLLPMTPFFIKLWIVYFNFFKFYFWNVQTFYDLSRIPFCTLKSFFVSNNNFCHILVTFLFAFHILLNCTLCFLFPSYIQFFVSFLLRTLKIPFIHNCMNEWNPLFFLFISELLPILYWLIMWMTLHLEKNLVTKCM